MHKGKNSLRSDERQSKAYPFTGKTVETKQQLNEEKAAKHNLLIERVSKKLFDKVAHRNRTTFIMPERIYGERT